MFFAAVYPSCCPFCSLGGKGENILSLSGQASRRFDIRRESGTGRKDGDHRRARLKKEPPTPTPPTSASFISSFPPPAHLLATSTQKKQAKTSASSSRTASSSRSPPRSTPAPGLAPPPRPRPRAGKLATASAAGELLTPIFFLESAARRTNEGKNKNSPVLFLSPSLPPKQTILSKQDPRGPPPDQGALDAPHARPPPPAQKIP